MKNKYRHDAPTLNSKHLKQRARLLVQTVSITLKTKVTGRMLCSICHIHTKKGHDEKLNPQDSTGM